MNGIEKDFIVKIDLTTGSDKKSTFKTTEIVV